jgi:DNA-binding CsgD family transcriptional regulator
MALTAEMVVLSGARWGATAITIGAIALFVVAALIKSDLYQATTAGLALAVTGVVAHAIAGLARQRTASVAIDSTVTPKHVVGETGGLSARELEVLRELVSGARNSEIATRLGISERTVKSHLKSIYQKLAVESRAAAVAAAIQRRLV